MVDVIADVRGAVVGERVVELRLADQLVHPPHHVDEHLLGLLGRGLRAIDERLLLEADRLLPNHVALVGQHVHQRVLVEETVQGTILLPDPLANLDRADQVVLVLEAEAEHRVGDRRIVVEGHDDEIDRGQFAKVERLVVKPHRVVVDRAIVANCGCCVP